MTAETVLPGVLTVHRGFLSGPDLGPAHAVLQAALAPLRRQAPEKDGRTVVRIGAPYTYMGRRLKHHPVPPALLELFAAAASATGAEFNAAVVNWYAGGDVGLPPHSDTSCIRELGTHPVIAGLSFGATRFLHLTPRSARRGLSSAAVELRAGDLYVMSGISQQRYHHSVPPSPGAGPRTSVTFRWHAQ